MSDCLNTDVVDLIDIYTKKLKNAENLKEWINCMDDCHHILIIMNNFFSFGVGLLLLDDLKKCIVESIGKLKSDDLFNFMRDTKLEKEELLRLVTLNYMYYYSYLTNTWHSKSFNDIVRDHYYTLNLYYSPKTWSEFENLFDVKYNYNETEVLHRIANDPKFYQIVTKRLQNDPSFFMKAFKLKKDVINHIPEKLKYDGELMINVFSSYRDKDHDYIVIPFIEYFATEVVNNKKYYMKILDLCPYAIRYIPSACDDEEAVIFSGQGKYNVGFSAASDRLKHKVSFIKAILYTNGLKLQYVPKDVITRELIEIALKQNKDAINFVPDEYKDEMWVKLLVDGMINVQVKGFEKVSNINFKFE